tara:strand:- start:285 stop:809 length:525 start_codon:yes stop_codon:yes gene_type:complete
MKSLFLFTILFFTVSFLCAQKRNIEIQIENKPPILVGEIDLTGLAGNAYKTWFDNNYKAYEVNTEMNTKLKDALNEYHILLFMGTWCGDSKREVPRFIKILESADFPMENLKMVALDYRKEQYKKSPNGEEWGLNIKRVPTFIFYKNGKEVSRIVERPIVSLEADMLSIVTEIR